MPNVLRVRQRDRGRLRAGECMFDCHQGRHLSVATTPTLAPGTRNLISFVYRESTGQAEIKSIYPIRRGVLRKHTDNSSMVLLLLLCNLNDSKTETYISSHLTICNIPCSNAYSRKTRSIKHFPSYQWVCRLSRPHSIKTAI